MSIKITIEDKIDIEDIQDDYKYARIAFLVDSPQFIEKMRDTRKLLDVTELIPYEEVKNWIHRKVKESSFLKMDDEDKKIANQRLRLGFRIGSIKEDFNKGLNFGEAIKYAILSGKVTEKEFNWSAFCVPYPFADEFNEQEFYTEEPMVAIFVNPDTQLSEIKQLFRTKVKNAFNETLPSKKVPRKSDNIRRDRQWYWQHIGGLSYQKIWDQIPEKFKPESKQAVINAIKRYEKNLAITK